jgi:hypothetical protein
MMDSHRLRWAHGEATVLATAAMLADCTFFLPGGPFKPFARAPWLGTVDDKAIEGHLRVLAGDFVGLPFGTSRELKDAPAAWASLHSPAATMPIHGWAADLDWTFVGGDDRSVTLSLSYPADSPVDRIERVISTRDDGPALDFTMRVFAKSRAATSLGLHPNFRLPETPGRLELKADFAFGLTHPGQTPPGTPHEFSSLAAVPKGTETVDMSHVPLSPRTDKNVMLCGMKGPLTATWLDEGAGIVLDWDRALIPSLMIWHTDGGNGGKPWNHQFRAVGLEPIASAFDLHTDISAGPNPINARGVKTSVDIDPARPLEVWHSVRAFAV